MITPISSNPPGGPTPIDTETLDSMTSTARSQAPGLPRTSTLPPPSPQTGSSSPLLLGSAPPIVTPPPMGAAEMSLLVNQLMNKSQDESIAVGQVGLENMNTQLKGQNAKIEQSIQKMVKAQNEANKHSKAADVGTSHIHSKVGRTFAKWGVDIATLGVGVWVGMGEGIAADVSNGKVGKEGANEQDHAADFMSMQKFVKKQDGYLSAIAKGLDQTASVTSEMKDGQQSAQQKILSGIQKSV